jgi:hypothetical protein
MPRHSTARTPAIRPRLTAVQHREAPAPTSLAKDDRVYLYETPSCVGTFRFFKATGEAVVDFALGRSEVPLWLLRKVEVG